MRGTFQLLFFHFFRFLFLCVPNFIVVVVFCVLGESFVKGTRGNGRAEKCGRVVNGSGRERESRVHFVPDREFPTPSDIGNCSHRLPSRLTALCSSLDCFPSRRIVYSRLFPSRQYCLFPTFPVQSYCVFPTFPAH